MNKTLRDNYKWNSRQVSLLLACRKRVYIYTTRGAFGSRAYFTDSCKTQLVSDRTRVLPWLNPSHGPSPSSHRVAGGLGECRGPSCRGDFIFECTLGFPNVLKWPEDDVMDRFLMVGLSEQWINFQLSSPPLHRCIISIYFPSFFSLLHVHSLFIGCVSVRASSPREFLRFEIDGI